MSRLTPLGRKLRDEREQCRKAEARVADLYKHGRAVHQAYCNGSIHDIAFEDAIRGLERALFSDSVGGDQQTSGEAKPGQEPEILKQPGAPRGEASNPLGGATTECSPGSKRALGAPPPPAVTESLSGRDPGRPEEGALGVQRASDALPEADAWREWFRKESAAGNIRSLEEIKANRRCSDGYREALEKIASLGLGVSQHQLVTIAKDALAQRPNEAPLAKESASTFHSGEPNERNALQPTNEAKPYLCVACGVVDLPSSGMCEQCSRAWGMGRDSVQRTDKALHLTMAEHMKDPGLAHRMANHAKKSVTILGADGKPSIVVRHHDAEEYPCPDSARKGLEGEAWIALDEQNTARSIMGSREACEEDANDYGQGWRVTGPYVLRPDSAEKSYIHPARDGGYPGTSTMRERLALVHRRWVGWEPGYDAELMLYHVFEMAHAEGLERGKVGAPRSETAEKDELASLRERMAKGRKKYPNGCTVTSLSDEAGEVVHAVNKYEPEERVREEILDVASVAMRLYLGEIDRGLTIDGLIQRRTDGEQRGGEALQNTKGTDK